MTAQHWFIAFVGLVWTVIIVVDVHVSRRGKDG